MPAGREAEVRPIDYPLSLELQEQIEILKSTRNAEEPKNIMLIHLDNY